MPTNVLMPALSPTMEKGKLAKWLKKEGDAVKSGDALAEIETDKATMEIEAVDEGTLGKILIADGTDDVAVNTPIAVILGEGEKASDISSDARSSDARVPQAPQNKEKSAEAPPQATPQVEQAPNGNSSRLLASPLAKRIAKQKGIDLASLKGSGPKGRIVLKDVEQGKPRSAPAGKPSISPLLSDDAILKLFEPGSFDLVPHDGLRKIIAARVTQSKQTIPHFYLSVDVALEGLLNLRERLNSQAPADKEGKPGWKISVNDVIIKALAMALIKVPGANVSWTEEAMVKHHHADVGVAVAIPGGLITPIVRKAETKGLAQIS
ncbi:MAG TPA: 2-oxo acid dehydrogenase subunit E2, partial [Aestuariivirga sp.]|nr:2-oxo acid dehydrogenase subunit E2 [Aestuariivirga sp.]